MITAALYLCLIPLVLGLRWLSGAVSQRLERRTGRPHYLWVMGGAGLLFLLITTPAFVLLPAFGSATKFRGAEIVDGDLFLLYEVGGQWHIDQIKVIDLADGHTKAIERLTGLPPYRAYELLGRRDGQVWLHSTDYGVHLRDGHTGRIALGEADLVAKNPELLAAGFDKEAMDGYATYWELDGKTGDLCLHTRDSYIVRLDAATLKGRRLAPNEQGCRARDRKSTASTVELSDGQRLGFEGAPRAQLVLNGPVDQSRILDPQTTFVAPAFLGSGRREPLRFKNGDALVTSTSDTGKRVVARVSTEDGRRRWTVTLRQAAATWGEVGAAFLRGEEVVIVTTGEIAALAAEDGRQVWDTRY